MENAFIHIYQLKQRFRITVSCEFCARDPVYTRLGSYPHGHCNVRECEWSKSMNEPLNLNALLYLIRKKDGVYMYFDQHEAHPVTLTITFAIDQP